MALIMSYFVLDDEMKLVQYLFCGLIIIGLLFVVWSNYSQEKNSGQAKYVQLSGNVQSRPPVSGEHYLSIHVCIMRNTRILAYAILVANEIPKSPKSLHTHYSPVHVLGLLHALHVCSSSLNIGT